MPTEHADDAAQVKAQILTRYPWETDNLTLSPVRDVSHGSVDGQEATIYYRQERRDWHHTGALYDCLTWNTSPGGNTSHSETLYVVGLKYIVAIHTIGGQASNEYDLIFLDPLAASNDQTMGLRVATIVDPPETLTSDFLCSEEPDHLFVEPTSSTPNLHIVVSTSADVGLSSHIWNHLLQPLLAHFNRSLGVEYILYDSASSETVAALAGFTLLPRAKQGIPQTVILLGGDDSVTDILNAMLSTTPSTSLEGAPSNRRTVVNPGYAKPILALLPCGTINAIAISNLITSNRITTHSTLGLRILLLGESSPLTFFRATFSPGACLVEPKSGKSRALARLVPKPRKLGSRADVMGKDEQEQERKQEEERGQKDEQEQGPPLPTLHGAKFISWGIHPNLRFNAAKSHIASITASSNTQDSRSTLSSPRPFPHSYEAQLTLYNSTRQLPMGGGHFIPPSLQTRQIVRTEHALVLIACCRYLDDGKFEISPDHEYKSDRLRCLELGSKLGDVAPGAKGVWEWLESRAREEGHANPTRHLGVGYHDLDCFSLRLPPASTATDDDEGEGQRLLCIDDHFVMLEPGGWVEVQEGADFRREEGILDLLATEWEGSELSNDDWKEPLDEDGCFSTPMDPDVLPRRLEKVIPVDEVR